MLLLPETDKTPTTPAYENPVLVDDVDLEAAMTTRNRKRMTRGWLRVGLILTDCFAIAAAYAVLAFSYFGNLPLSHFWTVLQTALPVYLLVAANARAFGVEATHRPQISVGRALNALLITAATLAIAAVLLRASIYFSRYLFFTGLGLSAISLALSRYFVSKLGQKLLPGGHQLELVILDGIDRAFPGAKVIDAAKLNLIPDPSNPQFIQTLGRLVSQVDRIIIACSPVRRARWAFVLKALDVDAEIYIPELTKLGAVAIKKISDKQTLVVSIGPMTMRDRVIKRCFDLAVVAVALPILAIPMLVVSIAIFIDSPGPILFRQNRIGLGNRTFQILKFRSMKPDLLDANGSVSTRRDDDRITRVGHFIRKTSIDELPQIFNVLAGTMSIVGPRPHAMGSLADDQLFWDIDQSYWHRHTIKPGITGLAQVRGFRGATEKKADLLNRLQSDLEYRANWSPLNDALILLATARVIIHRNAF